MTETTCAAGCSCISCSDPGGTEADDTHTGNSPRTRPRRHVRRSLPCTSSIMEVLYPSSYLGTSLAFPDPPAYSPPRDANPSIAQGDHTEPERSEHISLTSSAETGTGVSTGDHHPLVEAPSLTGVPSQAPGALSGRTPLAELNGPIDVLDEAEPPPAYSRFDDNQSRLPVAADVLGPYPPMPVLNPPTRLER